MFTITFKSLLASMFAALAMGLASQASAASAMVDVNKANQAELESVKGIGPGLSGRILQARSSGGFKDWNDMIQRVQGVGAGSAARLSSAGLTVAGTGFDASAAAMDKAGNKPGRGKKAGADSKATEPATAATADSADSAAKAERRSKRSDGASDSRADKSSRKAKADVSMRS